MRRPLWETIVELVEALQPAGRQATGVRVTSVALDVPVDAALAVGASGPVLMLDLPRTRVQTSFDSRPSHLTIRLEEIPS